MRILSASNLFSSRNTAITLLAAFLIAFWFCLPDPLFNKPTSYVVESRDGQLLSASTADDGQWRFVASGNVPDKFEKCIIAFEDKRFYYHPGIDFLALARAMRLNFNSKKTVSGGSTISMQVIRLATGGKRTYLQKIAEMIRALRLELSRSKSEILVLYSSNAPFGKNIVGLEAAAWRYFGRSAEKLSWGEMAALAVLPNAPGLVHPGKNREILRQKRDKLIDRLKHQNLLSEPEARLAKLEDIPSAPQPLPARAPHLLNYIKTQFKKGVISQTHIRSSIQGSLQLKVDQILKSHHKRFLANGVNNCAALVLDVESGQALAYVGNVYDPGLPAMESHVDMIQGLRSPGSTLKPLLYATMLNEGMLLPNSLIPDVPTQIAGYQPNNYDLGYDGAVPASKALARSLNVPAVKMLQQYRYEKFHGFLKSIGVSTLTHEPDFYGLSLILGGSEHTMWELAGIYASMARVLKRYNANRHYQDTDWRLPNYQAQELEQSATGNSTGRLNAASIYFSFEAMNEVMRPGDELLWKQFSTSQQIAWKTGTSFGFRDGWAIGLTPSHVVAVWVGNADGEGRPRLTGIDAAAPILFDIFKLLPDPENGWFKMPYPEMKKMAVCRQSGNRASDMCTEVEQAWMPKTCSSSPVCNYHQLVHLDISQKWRVSSECESPSKMVHKSWFVLPPTMEYYFKTKNFSYKILPPFRADCLGTPTSVSAMEIIYPKAGASLYIPLELDGQKGEVIFKAAHRDVNATIYWHLNDKFAGATTELHQMAFNPSRGKHILSLVDDAGNRIQQSFTIIEK